MKKRTNFLCTTGVLLGLSSGGPLVRADLISPSHSSFGLTAESKLTNSGGQTDSASEAQGSSLHSMSISVAANSIAGLNDYLQVTGNGSATWNSASSGVVSFTNLGWKSKNADGTADLSRNTGWVYTFVSNVTGSFNINYSVTAQSSSLNQYPLAGLNGFFLYEGAGSSPPTTVTDQISVNATPGGTSFSTSGATSLALTAGKTYTVEIQNFANLAGNIGTTNAHMNGTFDFSVVPTPEPSSLTVTIAICCLGGIAVLVKSRRHAAQQRMDGE